MFINYHQIPLQFDERTLSHQYTQDGHHYARVIAHGKDHHNYKLIWDLDQHQIDFEHPDHVEQQDYDHYHRAWQKPPIKCYLCHRTIDQAKNWFLATPTNILHVICDNCPAHLINIDQLHDEQSLSALGFAFNEHPQNGHHYFIDPYDLKRQNIQIKST